jgi:hypothetical protein
MYFLAHHGVEAAVVSQSWRDLVEAKPLLTLHHITRVDERTIKTMRVIFLGSAYFGYVYTYAFNPSVIDTGAYTLAEQARNAIMSESKARPAPKAAIWLRARLKARGRSQS